VLNCKASNLLKAKSKIQIEYKALSHQSETTALMAAFSQKILQHHSISSTGPKSH